MLEKRWEMAKWVTSYIKENEERWAKDKLDREKNQKKWLDDWARKSRFEKIREIRERDAEKKHNMNITFEMKPGRLCSIPPKPEDDHTPLEDGHEHAQVPHQPLDVADHPDPPKDDDQHPLSDEPNDNAHTEDDGHPDHVPLEKDAAHHQPLDDGHPDHAPLEEDAAHHQPRLDAAHTHLDEHADDHPPLLDNA